MRISDPNNVAGTVPTETTATHVVAPQDGTKSATARVGSDHADLSGVAGKLVELLQAGSETRASRIAQLRTEVAAGTYHVDATAISRAMVQDALNSGR